MLRPSDLYTLHETFDLYADPIGGRSSLTPIGKVLNDWEIRRYVDTRGLQTRSGFMVSVTQRIVIPANLTQQDPASGYAGYSAMLTNAVVPTGYDEKNDVLELIDYAPITVNAAVDSSTNSTVGSNASDSKQYTTGSSTSATNTFDVSVNLSQAGGVTAGYGHSQTSTEEQSKTAGASRGTDMQTGASASMSIKEWGSYLKIDVAKQAPSWTWTQEYPWNVFLYQDIGSSQAITVPPFVYDRLFLQPPPPKSSENGSDDTPTFSFSAAPPSSLSLTGLSFVSKARWIYLPANADTLRFAQTLCYWTGSHTFTAANDTNVTLTQIIGGESSTPVVSEIRRLATYALAPVQSDARGALVSFTPSRFPAGWQSGSPFAVVSGTNDVLVEGQGFDFAAGADAVFQADLTAGAPATFTASFKITEPDQEYSLYLKHWNTSDIGVTLSLTINGSAAITRHVDAREGGGGSDNILRVFLRNLDYASPEFFDYLVLGLNRVTVTISRDDSGTDPCGYALRALAIA